MCGNKCPFSQFAQVSERHISEPPRRQLALRQHCASNGSCSPFGFFHCHQCWLTCRSTGPIAAGRHLGYKSLAQTPARRNRPVSFDVSHHKRRTVQCSALSKSRPSEISARFGRKYQNSRARSLSRSSMRGPTAAKSVAGWRFAPACCAAQPVKRGRRRSAVLSSTPSPYLQAVEALRLKRSQAWQQVSVQPIRPSQRAASFRIPKKTTCSSPALRVQWFMLAIRALSLSSVLANLSLNRTYCGGPAFGLQKPSPNTSPPQ